MNKRLNRLELSAPKRDRRFQVAPFAEIQYLIAQAVSFLHHDKGSFSRSARRTVRLRVNGWRGSNARRNSSLNKSFTSIRRSWIGRLAIAKSTSHTLANLSRFAV